MNKSLIHFIITGGTIDSEWKGATDSVVVREKSILPEYFEHLSKNLKFYDEFIFSEICMKDSRAINDQDREKVLKAIEESEADKIIVTHGTYTLPDTARFIKANLKRQDQIIIITGSMVPLHGFDYSDAPFNLGYTFAQMQILEPGIYVCMNARVFTPEEVAKNIEEGKFYSLFNDVK
jgi:L-asparaginase